MGDTRDGALLQRDLPNGRELVLYPMIYTLRLCFGWQGDGGYSRAWCYEPRFLTDATIALLTWNGEGDPPGRWLKEVGTERRRTYDAEGEQIYSQEEAI